MEQNTAPLWVMLPTVILTVGAITAVMIAVVKTEQLLRRIQKSDSRLFMDWGRPSFFSFNPLAQIKAYVILQKTATNTLRYPDSPDLARLHSTTRKSLLTFTILLATLMIFGLTVSALN